MAEYIEFEATKQAIDRIRSVYHRARNFNAVSAIDNVFGEIKEIPAADVAPVVHGRWYMRGGRACCSNCNIKALWKSDWDGCKNHEREFVSAKSNYCPHCGAKMDEEVKK